MPSKTAEKRERDIRLFWEREPNATILQRDRAPPGLRTPNGFVWGHQVDHIFWIQRMPGAQALTVWSRSMIKEGGEGHDEHQWDEPLTSPRVRRPWPVLKKFLKEKSIENAYINEPDRGCADEHWKGISPPAGWKRDPGAVLSPEMLEFLGECEHDPEEQCTGPMLSNVGPERVANPQGEFYDYVWCEHFKALLNQVCDPQPFLAHAIAVTGHVHIVPDATGLIFYAPPGDVDDASKGKARDSVASASAVSSVDSSQGTASASTDGDISMADDASGVSAEGSAGPDEDSASNNGGATAAETSSSARARSLPLPRNPFLADDLPKLEEFIPEEHLPDILMVHDPNNVTNGRKAGRSDVEPIKYKRFYPSPTKDEESEDDSPKKEKVSQLYLNKTNRFGTGNHSFVYRAPLTLPAPLYARSQSGQVTVAAKLAYDRCTAHGLLHNEARVYDSLPKHTQEDWCGYNVVPQCRFPVPVSAIAPKFYGYYLPVDDKGNVKLNEHKNCSEENPCRVQWPSPILLMEECGNPVEPSKFTADQRTECFSLILRLHHMDIVQGSFYVRNIMCQPGPLTAPPAERSYNTPSFRIIDFGRGKCWDWELEEGGDVEKRRFEFARRIGDEVARARSELLIEDFGF